jgi:hypothetical protein
LLDFGVPQYNSTMVGVFPEVVAVAVLGVAVKVMKVQAL